MSDTPAVEPGTDHCTYPGCTRPRRPDPATGRPTRYCEQADASGGPVHNRVTAWKARQTQQGTITTQAPSAATAPVSLARATLEQHLAELPGKLTEQRRYLDALVDALRAASDLEAAGAEVEDAHRDALAKVVDAERRAVEAERIARGATARAETAESDRDEADTLAADALAETARIREDTQAELQQLRTAADAEVSQAREELATATTHYDTTLAQARDDAAEARAAAAAAHTALEAAEARAADTIAELRADLESARRDVQVAVATESGVRVELATITAELRVAQQAAAADREALAATRQEFERQRIDFHAERDAQRAAHAEQVENLIHSADQRAQALTDALSAAREVAETYRAQLKQPKRATSSAARKSTSPA